MEDKILKKLSQKLEEEIQLIAKSELNEAKKYMDKSKEISCELKDKLEKSFDEKMKLIKDEARKINALENRVSELENKLNIYLDVIQKLKPLTRNNKFIKKYLE